jgi:hypothetical protein
MLYHLKYIKSQLFFKKNLVKRLKFNNFKIGRPILYKMDHQNYN